MKPKFKVSKPNFNKPRPKYKPGSLIRHVWKAGAK